MKGLLLFLMFSATTLFAQSDYIYTLNEIEHADFLNSYVIANENERRFIITINSGSKKYFIIDKNKFGPYDKITIVKISKTRIIGIKATNSKKKYFISTAGKTFGKIYGPFKNIYNQFVAENGQVFLYIKNWNTNKKSLILNEKNIGNYNELIDYYYNHKENFWFFSVKKGKKYFLIANNKPTGPYNTPPIIAYSKYNDSSWGYGVETNGKFYIVMSFEKVLGPYKKIKKIGFSDYSNSWYVIVEEVNNKITKDKILINGMQSYLKGKFKQLVFNKRGSAFAINITKKDGDYLLFSNGEIFGPVDEIKNIVIGNTINKNIFSYKKDGKYFIRLNGKTSASFNEYPQLLLNNEGSILGYSYKKNSDYFVYFDKKRFGPFTSPVHCAIGKDKNWAFYVKEDSLYKLFFNGEYIGDFEEIGNIIFKKINKNIKMIFIAKKNGIWDIYKDKNIIVHNAHGFYLSEKKNKIYYFSLEGKSIKINFITL